jgi:hypothetical protein
MALSKENVAMPGEILHRKRIRQARYAKLRREKILPHRALPAPVGTRAFKRPSLRPYHA